MKSLSFLLHGVHEDAASSLADWLGQFSTGARMSPFDASSSPSRIGLANHGAIEIIDPLSVVCVEGSRNYSVFHLANGRSVTVSYSLGRFDGQLPSPYFLRVHKRYIVNLLEVVRYVKKDGGILAMSNDMEIPISAVRRKEFLDWVHRGGNGSKDVDRNAEDE